LWIRVTVKFRVRFMVRISARVSVRLELVGQLHVKHQYDYYFIIVCYLYNGGLLLYIVLWMNFK